jgi:hypothetical protein
MPFEDELTDALRSTADGFQPDLTSLVNAGVRDGRRRSRRRTLGVVGGVAALALVGIGGAAASGVLTGGQTTRSAAPVARTVTRPPAPVAKPTVAAPVLPKFTAAQTLAAFEGMLPKGDTVTQAQSQGFTLTKSHGLAFISGPMASLVLADGIGGSAMFITVTRPAGKLDDPSLLDYVACPGHAVRPDITCTRTRLADGSVLAVMQGLESPHSSTEKDWTAWLATKDGGLIELDETNSAQEKGGVSRPEPILTKAQLASIASDPLWRTLAAKLPAPRVR